MDKCPHKNQTRASYAKAIEDLQADPATFLASSDFEALGPKEKIYAISAVCLHHWWEEAGQEVELKNHSRLSNPSMALHDDFWEKIVSSKYIVNLENWLKNTDHQGSKLLLQAAYENTPQAFEVEEPFIPEVAFKLRLEHGLKNGVFHALKLCVLVKALTTSEDLTEEEFLSTVENSIKILEIMAALHLQVFTTVRDDTAYDIGPTAFDSKQFELVTGENGHRVKFKSDSAKKIKTTKSKRVSSLKTPTVGCPVLPAEIMEGLVLKTAKTFWESLNKPKEGFEDWMARAF